ncbi:MAG: SMC-Scp complex subunit ScpB [Christensenellaceae bacterium]|jgi:segregation and condensation protein B|nr:SMC-Scp complex subunit ScpB [Christensenellaceae bacterium]
MDTLEQKIEAILFVAGDGLAVDFLADKLSVPESEIDKALKTLTKKYSGDSGVHLIKYRNNYQFCSNPTVAEAVSAVLNPVRERNLTSAAMETMAIVAYKQPVTKLEIDEIRGVSSEYGIHVLMQNNLIEVVGRKDALGKPLLYGTTDTFLKRFELADINNLPSYDELIEKIKLVPTGFDLYNAAN